MAATATLAFWLCVVFATVTPVTANTIDDCKWTTNDPEAVVRGCTTLLGAAKVAEPWMYFNRGLAFKILGRVDEAYRDYSKAIELNPSFGAAYTNRGNVRLLRNDLTGAMADFR